MLHTAVKRLPPLRKALLQKLCQYILPDQLQLSLIRHAECRIQSDVLKIVPQHKQTEAVDGRNLGVVHQCRLSLEMFVFPVLVQPV